MHVGKKVALCDDCEKEDEMPAIDNDKREGGVPPKRSERAMEIVKRERGRREAARRVQKERQQQLLDQQHLQRRNVPPLVPALLHTQPATISSDLYRNLTEQPLKAVPSSATSSPVAPPIIKVKAPKPKIGVFYKGSPQKDIMDQLLVANSAQAAMRRKQRRDEKEAANRERALIFSGRPSNRRPSGGEAIVFTNSTSKKITQFGRGGRKSIAVDLRRRTIKDSMDGAVVLSRGAAVSPGMMP